MNTQLVDSIVQMISNLPVEERELVKQRLWLVADDDAADAQDRNPPANQRRVFGQYRGRISMSEDFDEPLPDSFWLGES